MKTVRGFILFETLLSVTIVSLVVLAHLSLIIQSESLKNKLQKRAQLYREKSNWTNQDFSNADCFEQSLIKKCSLETEYGSKEFISFRVRHEAKL